MTKEIHGGDIYSRSVALDFSANINPLGMPPEVKAAAVQSLDTADRYPDVQCRQLRRAMSEHLAVPQEHIICGNGAAELIFALAQTLQPRRALLAAPGFAEYAQALSAAGCDIVYHTLTKENGFVLQQDYLDDLTDDLDIVFLCNPNNPTGLPVAPELLRQIVRTCQEKGIRIVVDECFNGLMDNGTQHSIISMLEENDLLIILGAFTKLYAMAGLRLGYMLSSDVDLLEQLHEHLQPWNVSIPAQAAGTAAMLLDGFEEKSRQYVVRERHFLEEGMDRLGLRYWKSAANFIFFEGPADLKERCLDRGILIRSCENYIGLKKGYFRIAVKRREENEQLLHVLEEIIEQKASC